MKESIVNILKIVFSVSMVFLSAWLVLYAPEWVPYPIRRVFSYRIEGKIYFIFFPYYVYLLYIVTGFSGIIIQSYKKEKPKPLNCIIRWLSNRITSFGVGLTCIMLTTSCYVLFHNGIIVAAFGFILSFLCLFIFFFPVLLQSCFLYSLENSRSLVLKKRLIIANYLFSLLLLISLGLWGFYTDFVKFIG